MLGLLGILVLIVIILFFISLITPQFYWQFRKVNHLKSWPLIGLPYKNLMGRVSLIEAIKYVYNHKPNSRYIGYMQFTTPVLMLRDPELIKQLCVKDFDNFPNHRILITDDIDPLFGKNLVSLSGHKWKEMRAMLSPSFTGSKMRLMYELIANTAKQINEYLTNETQIEGTTTVDIKDILSRYANDVIATTAFGLKCDSLEDKDNSFFMFGKKTVSVTFSASFKLLGYLFLPSLMKKMKIRLFSRSMNDFFCNVIKTTVETRKKEGIVRPDMIHLLMEAQKERLKLEQDATANDNITIKELTLEDITAQAVLFFLAGYDTTSTMMTFMSYELAINPDIQKRIQEEIDSVLEKTQGEISYDSVMSMKYLDMAISESLRKWPPAIFTDRIAIDNYNLKKANSEETEIVLEKNVNIWIPILCMHHDPKYFPDPERFDPERFSEENKNKIVPFTYLPFGVGPRNCIASRFALLEVKTLYVHLLSKFDIVPVKDTQIPVVLSKRVFGLRPEKDIMLGIKPRQL